MPTATAHRLAVEALDAADRARRDAAALALRERRRRIAAEDSLAAERAALADLRAAVLGVALGALLSAWILAAL